MSTAHFTIGALSRASGVNLETIRYYERVGLLPAPQRAGNGYRRYDGAAVQRLRFVRRGRELGFSIDDIRTLLQLADHPAQPCAQADALAARHLADVQARIRDLVAVRDELLRLSACHSDNAEHCRLLEALDARACDAPGCLGADTP